ncbi:glycine zipper family protein [Photobacterium profundum]|uniref:glycine zipper family protein n=1 Tax=Photobacterium profundum TaxID=74109 RepID=UPI003D0AED19
MMKKITILLGASLLTACSYNAAPIVGPHDKTDQEYQQDYAECEMYAARVDKGEAVKTGIANGALVGVASGAIAGLIDGGVVEGAAIGVAVGAGSGAAGGALKATDDQSLVLRRCLDSKGYDVYDLRS